MLKFIHSNIYFVKAFYLFDCWGAVLSSDFPCFPGPQGVYFLREWDHTGEGFQPSQGVFAVSGREAKIYPFKFAL
jgi:hypothetical protein